MYNFKHKKAKDDDDHQDNEKEENEKNGDKSKEIEIEKKSDDIKINDDFLNVNLDFFKDINCDSDMGKSKNKDDS